MSNEKIQPTLAMRLAGCGCMTLTALAVISTLYVLIHFITKYW